MKNVYQWFAYNSMKANPDKLQFIILGNIGSHALHIGDITIKSALSVTRLAIAIDSKFNIKKHISNTEKTEYYKLYAFSRLRKFLTLEKT